MAKKKTTFNRWDVITNKNQSKGYRIFDNITVFTGPKDGEVEYLVVREMGKTKLQFIKKEKVKDWINWE